MNRITKVLIVAAVIVVTAVISWRVTMLSLSLRVTDDTAYITSFGQTDEYDYYPDF